MSQLIRLDNVGKTFVTEEVETHAHADVNLEIRAGEFLSIQGPLGCGKGTVLSILGLLAPPPRGADHPDPPGPGRNDEEVQPRQHRRHLLVGHLASEVNLPGDTEPLRQPRQPPAPRPLAGKHDAQRHPSLDEPGDRPQQHVQPLLLREAGHPVINTGRERHTDALWNSGNPGWLTPNATARSC